MTTPIDIKDLLEAKDLADKIKRSFQAELEGTYIALGETQIALIATALDAARAEGEIKGRNDALAEINTPEIEDFMKGIPLEAAHQIERWGKDHDEQKTDEDWFWLIAYLSTKAHQAIRYGDQNKALHHTITVAAVCLNWHKKIRALIDKVPG